MNHCLLITVYHDVESLNRIIRHTPDKWGVYVHIDKKSAIQPSEVESRMCVRGVFKTFSIYWGGIEHLKAFLFLINKAVTSRDKYDYFHLISGQDFYATSPGDFDIVLGNEGVNYMGIFPLPNLNWGWEYGLAIFKYRTLSSKGDIRKLPWRYLNSLLKYIQIIFHCCRQLPDFPLYGGPVYCSLTFEFVNWCLKSPVLDNLLSRLCNSTCAEEVFFQTLIMNSPFSDKVSKDKSLRYVDWNSNPRPKYLDISDFSKIVESQSLFCRKIDSLGSASLIEELERKMFCAT